MDIKSMLGGSDNKKTIMVLGLILLMVVVLAVITILFFNDRQEEYINTDLPAMEDILPPQPQQNVAMQNPSNAINTTLPTTNNEYVNNQPTANAPTNNPANTDITLQEVASNVESKTPKATPTQNIQNPSTPTIAKLKYTIKPINKDIASCITMRNGSWVMPKSCSDEVVYSVRNLINTNTELIAIEVSGIVDSNPYSGPSAELKQEGLASFRAREAISLITRAFSNVAVFEGPSMQINSKRGFQIKAYYLQN